MTVFEYFCRPRPWSGQPNIRIMHQHAQRLKMPQVLGQYGQPVLLGGGGAGGY
jgi:hypothetical protein